MAHTYTFEVTLENEECCQLMALAEAEETDIRGLVAQMVKEKANCTMAKFYRKRQLKSKCAEAGFGGSR